MCAPCKEVINHGFTAAASRAHIIRDILVSQADGSLIPTKEDDDLYAMARAEVEAIAAIRKAGVAMAKRVGATERWRLLMEAL